MHINNICLIIRSKLYETWNINLDLIVKHFGKKKMLKKNFFHLNLFYVTKTYIFCSQRFYFFHLVTTFSSWNISTLHWALLIIVELMIYRFFKINFINNEYPLWSLIHPSLLSCSKNLTTETFFNYKSRSFYYSSFNTFLIIMVKSTPVFFFIYILWFVNKLLLKNSINSIYLRKNTNYLMLWIFISYIM